MADSSRLTLSLVTPEKTLLKAEAGSVRLPLFDGAAGVFPGRAPMVGRLGYGPLTVSGLSDADAGEHAPKANPDGTRTWFVEGGFVQVAPGGPDAAGGTAGAATTQVAVLTNRAVDPATIDPEAAKAELAEVAARVPTTPEARTQKDRDQARLRASLAAAK